MSVTGQTGHIAVAKQTAFGTPNTTAAKYRGVKITGDSVVSANNPLTANNEIGVGRDITASIPGGYSAAGSLSGNLRARAAGVFLEGAVGPHSAIAADGTATPKTVAYDSFELIDINPFFTIEKKVGASTAQGGAAGDKEQMAVQWTDCVINTLNIAAPSAAFATFSAGIIACGEKFLTSTDAGGLVNVEDTPYNASTFKAGYDPASDQILAFHGGRILAGTSKDGAGWAATGIDGAGTKLPKPDGTAAVALDETFMSFEVDINNNAQSDEYTVRPSRFLRSITQGIRSISCNITQVFTDFIEYQQYTYGDSSRTTPGYQLYTGAIDFFLGNWQVDIAQNLIVTPLTGGPTSPQTAQGIQIFLPKLAFSGFPVALTTGRIQVTTTAQSLKAGAGPCMNAWILPQGAGFDY